MLNLYLSKQAYNLHQYFIDHSIDEFLQKWQTCFLIILKYMDNYLKGNAV